MADQTTGNSTSPWEEVLEIPADTKPKIFGSLDNTPKNVATESQELKVPDHIPAGVGSKVPAAQIVAKQASKPPTTEIAKPVIPQGEILQPKVASPVSPKESWTGQTKVEVPKPVISQKEILQPKPVVSPPPVSAKEAPPERPKQEIPEPALIPSPPPPPLSKPSSLPAPPLVQPQVAAVPSLQQIPKPKIAKKQIFKSIFPRFKQRPAATPKSEIPKESLSVKLPVSPPASKSIENFAKPKPSKPSIEPPETGKTQALPPQPKTTKDSQITASTVARFSNLTEKIKEFFFKPKLLIAAIAIVLVTGLVYFNETGLLPTGVEKIYGIFRLESLWDGLPADPQLALAKSFQKIQTQQSFKLESKTKFTVNKNSESKITDPLFSLASPIFLVALDNATLAASDQSQESQLLDTSSTETGSSSIEEPSTEAISQNSQVPTDSSANSSQTNQGAETEATVISDQSSVKEFSANANLYLSAQGSSTQIEVTDESNKKSTVNLLSQSSKLYVRTTNVDYSGSAKDWVSFDLPSAEKEALPSIFSSPDLTGFSVTGNRLGSGKINGIPVYRYQVSIKIGSLLSKIGIKDEMVNSITGEIDIGKRDQLIHYLNLTINPAVNSSISRIDFEAAVKDFNVEESLSVPGSFTEVTAGPTAPPAVSTNPPTSTASAELLVRDATRKTDLRNIEAALSSYYTKNGQYPSTSNQMIQTRAKGNALSRALVPTYLATMPVDPWTDKYYYGYKSDGLGYELSAVLGNNSDTDGTLSNGKNIYLIKY